MKERAPEQLDKILALADSSHEGEAVVAVRKARQMLSRDGLSFGDLARVASSRQANPKEGSPRPSGVFSFLSEQRDYLESQIHYLRQQLQDVQAQLQTQDIQLAFWRRRAMDLEHNSQQAQSEAERWKKLARDTAERLWDVGHSLSREEFESPAPVAESVAGEK